MNLSTAAAARSNARTATFDLPRNTDTAHIGYGFFDSSIDLRRGCLVTETPVAMIPEELMREFRRQQMH